MILTTLSALGYPAVIQFKRGGWRKWVCAIPACVVFVLDIVANYTELAWALGWPREKEYSISRRVRRMIADENELPPRRELARMVQVYLDAFEKDGKH